MRSNQGPKSNRRSRERFVIPAEIPVYLQTVFNEFRITLLVEDLSIGGALLICPDICESLEIGQCLHGLLIMPCGKASVDVIVRWRVWPRVGVQFDGISPEVGAQISQVIDAVSAKT
jgi:c-di-GMP-binding flagellar brake protein YcgR